MRAVRNLALLPLVSWMQSEWPLSTFELQLRRSPKAQTRTTLTKLSGPSCSRARSMSTSIEDTCCRRTGTPKSKLCRPDGRVPRPWNQEPKSIHRKQARKERREGK
ncbi:hypothetical protein BKA80DRAFT_263207 [Phyllosticta citrichinensis]